MPSHPIIPCSLREDWAQIVDEYSDALKAAAHTIGSHGLDREAFEESGLFKSAIERIRGQQAATTSIKYAFIEDTLKFLQSNGLIQHYEFVGSRDRHDFEVHFDDGRLCCIEAKGCLDGNNTNIFVRPQNADEFIIWSLCQNPGSDPRHNAWSGIHTRLSAEIVARRERVDGLIIWDMLCGTLARPCPKLQSYPDRFTNLSGKHVPPPCIYLFPRTIPDARNNPNPTPWNLSDIRFLKILANAFHTLKDDAVKVRIEVRMHEADIQRRTTYTTNNSQLHQSGWTSIRRAR
ncbi:hypothetical protein [Nitrosomonas sp. Nm132]|uniref:hypothetical protein n=1 Tax=Nitrosomonas sp. Nm132 TaxID=1881053 RepID=UPI000881E961|nr:hypothetical protein [Nitrosomonas sp. Nm132]SDH26671.1 hypothetical protein SAMN05428952_100953 [Nitrosomonas sp. Nm132]